MGGERRVTTVGQAELNFIGIEHVRQVPRADPFDVVGEDHDPDGGVDKVVAVDQCIDQQFFEHFFWHFQLAEGVEALLELQMVQMVQIAFDEGQAASLLLLQVAVDVLAVEVLAVMQHLAKCKRQKQQNPNKAGFVWWAGVI
ncbi:hypothetical protein [Pseudomonas asplenii]|uniref:hypothetical protein n=1 Tax=Pseudomonas asplenii TaxID=53407 RepID=UPI0012FD0C85|nr:hypothetical protein [Pseudomonas asplenii]